ncbi:MAG TPA: DUF5924 family protein [Gammaproteobacteria bacterium]
MQPSSSEQYDARRASGAPPLGALEPANGTEPTPVADVSLSIVSLSPAEQAPAADGLGARDAARADRRGNRLVARVAAAFARYPWLLPAASFAAGWAGFVMVHRGEELARMMALLALLGWPWLLVEPLIRRRLERRKPRMGKLAVNFVSQSLQQELLFFSLPFLIGATQLDTGQIAFTALAGAAALLTTIDPLYERWVAKRAARRLLFHAYCSWLAALVVLPMVLRLPVERALPLSLIGVTAWLILTLPLSLPSLRTRWGKAAWVAGVALVPSAVWAVRAQVPAAGLAVTEARITQTVENYTPGERVRVLRRSDLQRGVIAYAAIRAPSSLTQDVIFEWRHNGERERIVSAIRGGRAQGYRTYTRKMVFPADPLGSWTVDVVTPQGQLLERMRFFVVDG